MYIVTYQIIENGLVQSFTIKPISGSFVLSLEYELLKIKTKVVILSISLVGSIDKIPSSNI